MILSDSQRLLLASIVITALLTGCDQKRTAEAPVQQSGSERALFRVGSIEVYESDVTRELEEKRLNPSDERARKKTMEELAERAQFAQAAIDANLHRDPAVRAQFARSLAARLKEVKLLPKLKEMTAAIPEARLRELYQADLGRYRSDEKRQVAVLWLNAKDDPERVKQYQEKLTAAREFAFASSEIKDHPAQGFSVLSVDHSEHPDSRYKGGIVGWLERQGGMDAWSKAVAEIVFSLKAPGDVSPVITRPEGVFLVRYMATQPAVQRPFETVRAELERAEQRRMRAAAEADYEAAIKAAHPVQWLTPQIFPSP